MSLSYVIILGHSGSQLLLLRFFSSQSYKSGTAGRMVTTVRAYDDSSALSQLSYVDPFVSR